MSLVQLWTDFLSRTQPVLNGSILFIYIQMAVGSVFPLLMIYRLTRRENKFETVLLCMVPFIFIVTAAVIEPLFFGSFLGEGFRKTDALRAFLAQSDFFRDALVLCGIFTLSAALYLLVEWKNRQLSSGRLLLEVGLESFLVLAVLVLSADHFRSGGELLDKMSGTAVKWLVYGIYLLVYKSSLFLVGLLWHLLFGIRTGRGKTDESVDAVKWLRKYLTQSYRAIGWGLTIFAVFYMIVVVYRLYLEEGVSKFFVTLLLLGALVLAGGLYALLMSFLTILIPGWRRMRDWGDEASIAHQAYQEIAVEKPLLKNEIALMTAHFLVMPAPYKRMFYLPLLQEIVTVNNGLGITLRLEFRDGGSCSVNPTNSGGAQVLVQIENMLSQ